MPYLVSDHVWSRGADLESCNVACSYGPVDLLEKFVTH